MVMTIRHITIIYCVMSSKITVLTTVSIILKHLHIFLKNSTNVYFFENYSYFFINLETLWKTNYLCPELIPILNIYNTRQFISDTKPVLNHISSNY